MLHFQCLRNKSTNRSTNNSESVACCAAIRRNGGGQGFAPRRCCPGYFTWIIEVEVGCRVGRCNSGSPMFRHRYVTSNCPPPASIRFLVPMTMSSLLMVTQWACESESAIRWLSPMSPNAALEAILYVSGPSFITPVDLGIRSKGARLRCSSFSHEPSPSFLQPRICCRH